mmetsp:Transcript_17946/g.32287  ORF Transcript_17946/g.32287 Transcript_17946/m.32287 type:complete len:225 (+) Transcript_17946:917-1591(+)
MSIEYPLLEPYPPAPSAPPPDSEFRHLNPSDPVEVPPPPALMRLQTIFPEYHGETKEANIKGFGRRVLAAAALLLITSPALPISVYFGYKNWYALAASLVLAILQILVGLMGVLAYKKESNPWTKRFKLSMSIYLLLLLLPFLIAYEIAGIYLTVKHNTNNCSEFSHYTVCDQRWGFFYTQLLLIVYLSALDLFLLMYLVSVRRACDKFIHIMETPHFNNTGIS